MKGRELNINQCIKQLRKKNDVFKIDDVRGIIYIEKRPKHQKHDLGNKSWGKIDFLTKNKNLFKLFEIRNNRDAEVAKA